MFDGVTDLGISNFFVRNAANEGGAWGIPYGKNLAKWEIWILWHGHRLRQSAAVCRGHMDAIFVDAHNI